MKGHFDAARAIENDCIFTKLPPFFLQKGGRGRGELTDADVSATGFVHCLACWPPTLTPPYRKSEILARSLVSDQNGNISIYLNNDISRDIPFWSKTP